MHGFGLPDLYDQDWTNPNGPIAIGGLASYELMANPYGWIARPAFPGILSAYTRKLVGWVPPIPITQDGIYPIQPAEVSQMTYMISNNYPAGEYLLIENRQPIRWDAWPGGGIVIYHIDENAPLQSHRGFPTMPRWPGYHYRAAVQQADGRYDLEHGVNLGDSTDWWNRNKSFGPDTSVWPNTASYSNGLVATGINITVISDSGFIMLFKVTGIKPSTSNGTTTGNGTTTTSSPTTTPATTTLSEPLVQAGPLTPVTSNHNQSSLMDFDYKIPIGLQYPNLMLDETAVLQAAAQATATPAMSSSKGNTTGAGVNLRTGVSNARAPFDTMAWGMSLFGCIAVMMGSLVLYF